MTERCTVMVEIEVEAMPPDGGWASPMEQALYRQAVIDALRDPIGIVAVLPNDIAKLMLQAHDAAAAQAGLKAHFPHPDYRPPHKFRR